MIVIQNPARMRRRWLKRIHWGVLFGLMALIYGSHAPLIALTKNDDEVPFNPSSCVVMIELAKLLISLAAFVLSTGTSTPPPTLVLMAPYAVPAVLYALNNNLVVLMQGYMDPSSYQILSNLKIASTALLYSLFLGKRLRPVQWLALGLLMCACVCQTYSNLDLGDAERRAEAEQGPRLHITTWGLFLVLVYCFVSGLAAVYTEMVLKSQKLPLSLQNLYLYAFGVAINGFSSYFTTSENSFLEGYSGVVWIIIAGQVANGLLMSVVLKHGSGITRLFVISCSMLVNALLSWAILGLQLTPFFLLPVSLIGLAAHLYYRQ
ncbi:probable UDP-sugar transporter protein SLC35A4 [Brachionichthys hirsutus]|uniref:probable UDP-sugar transporter protein SLC35A4 n=1 Tax=Brachionichthys hirsutus TaxID=412623 RepID=UPI00360528FE